ncbi:hypothetical protein GCM10010358_13090 [Streptomyces minutiscleroticus]|uniref:MarR family transcriptional regulator n=1 Tax=Streptomyces minutiscleroticus TaxID=68238 RepID=A0A918KEQ1_9ACTN|nr:hypothetical protein GCM10010358_13090 [Streptomyces minutiscleroticus]
MTATAPAVTALAQGWCALPLLHDGIESRAGRALQAGHGLSAREYSLLDVLGRRHDGEGGHLRMRQVADAVVLSRSATTSGAPAPNGGRPVAAWATSAPRANMSPSGPAVPVR